jgi:hypothetical protein
MDPGLHRGDGLRRKEIEMEDQRELCMSFFEKFSRFEFAMKKAGYAKGDNNGADADWHKLFENNEMQKLFNDSNMIEDNDLKNAVKFLLDDPPGKRVIRQDGSLDFRKTQQTEKNAQKLSVYVRRVRNNLFHGDKFIGDCNDWDRDSTLLKSVLTILDACLGAVPELKDAY